MSNLNKAQVIWNITSDIELKQTPWGTSVTSFSVATNRKWKDGNWQMQEQAEFHNIVLWSKLAEICAQYLKKWSKVFIEGRLQTRNWEDKTSGKKMYRTEIIGENMIMLGTKDTDATKIAPNPSKGTPAVDEEISVEDLPF